jgi:predicted ATPase
LITTVAVQGYRSLRDVVLPLTQLTVVTGPNGSGKSSLYRALRLLADCASGQVIGSVAREGGLRSVLWAGPAQLSAAVRRGDHPVQGTTRQKPVSLQLGFAGEDLSYLIDLGLPTRDERSAFNLDPEIKRELVFTGPVPRPATLLVRRTRRLVEIREGGWQPYDRPLDTFDSILTEVVDPLRAPELITLRQRVSSWRFYDQFRTDRHSPSRQPQIGTRTPALDSEGEALAAAWRTIEEIGDDAALSAAVEDAFPGSAVQVVETDGRFTLHMQTPGLLRPLSAAELSDGTLRYLLLTVALLSPRPPALLVVNEPETSLHPDLRPALARLLITAARRTQIVVVTHSVELAEAVGSGPSCSLVRLDKDLGETVVTERERLSTPAWDWGSR